MSAWEPLGLASPLSGPPSTVAPSSQLGTLGLLPLNQLTWEDFEKLQLRVLRDVEGLRDARIYGDKGQSQNGLDLVALAPDGAGVALQSKKYTTFSASHLTTAVRKFRETERPFGVDRLIVGVARPVTSTGVAEALLKHGKELSPVTLELWDAHKLSQVLKTRPEIVVEFFGMPTAEAFCLPFKVDVRTIPPAEAVAVQEAIARTPEVVTGAKQLFDLATSETDPTRALSLIEEGQSSLRAAGFGPQAALMAKDRDQLLARLGRTSEAARLVVDDFWAALDQGLSGTAQVTQARLAELLKASPGDEEVELYQRVTNTAVALYLNPLGKVLDSADLRIGDSSDQARLVLLAGETALANDDESALLLWAPAFKELADIASIDLQLRTRLRILLAETTDDWGDLLDDARKLRIGHGLLGLVTARYARRCALHQRFQEADEYWSEASGVACLAQQWQAASAWILSCRSFRSRWQPFTGNSLLPLQTAIQARGSSMSLLPISHTAYEEALTALNEKKLRPAAISAQRALRDAVTTANWFGEERARRALAAVLLAADEPRLAARQYARAGDTTAIEALGDSRPLEFVDTIQDLGSTNYWTVGTTYRLLATQADLVPDAFIGQISACILAELTAAEEGSAPDLRSFGTSRYNNAVKALAGIANRLELANSAVVLTHFEKQASVEENHYRYHDKDEAIAVSSIALNQPSLAGRAIAHLVALLARSQAARTSSTLGAVQANLKLAHDSLALLAQAGNRWAIETLSLDDPAEVDLAATESALIQLSTPLNYTDGVYSVGNNAIGSSLLVRHLPADVLSPVIAELLARADDPHLGSLDRGEYLIAASNLTNGVNEPDRRDFFEAALRLATQPTESESDVLDAQFSHKLGAFRMTGTRPGTRGQAVLLASTLAVDAAERNAVRGLAYTLIGEESDYWPARALQRLGDAIKDDLAFLAGQGWAMRCVAAIVWARHGEPSVLGGRLAIDADVRVRRALADALAAEPETSHVAVRLLLAADPAYSVREALRRRPGQAAVSE